MKLARLVKLVKLTRLARIVKTSRSQYTNLIKFGVTIMFLLHWVACAWCLLGQLQRDADADNWISHVYSADEQEEAPSGPALYMFGLEFAIFSMVLGFGRSTPQTFAEQFIAVLVLGVMGTIYAYLLGSVWLGYHIVLARKVRRYMNNLFKTLPPLCPMVPTKSYSGRIMGKEGF